MKRRLLKNRLAKRRRKHASHWCRHWNVLRALCSVLWRWWRRSWPALRRWMTRRASIIAITLPGAKFCRWRLLNNIILFGLNNHCLSHFECFTDSVRWANDCQFRAWSKTFPFSHCCTAPATARFYLASLRPIQVACAIPWQREGTHRAHQLIAHRCETNKKTGVNPPVITYTQGTNGFGVSSE